MTDSRRWREGHPCEIKQQIQTWANLRVKGIYWETRKSHRIVKKKQNSQLLERSGTRVAPGSKKQKLAISLKSVVGVALSLDHPAQDSKSKKGGKGSNWLSMSLVAQHSPGRAGPPRPNAMQEEKFPHQKREQVESCVICTLSPQ